MNYITEIETLQIIEDTLNDELKKIYKSIKRNKVIDIKVGKKIASIKEDIELTKKERDDLIKKYL